MEVHIDRLAKRYLTHWVFRDLSAVISSGLRVSVTGPNGAGKSTLLKIVSGALHPSEGVIAYHKAGAIIPTDKVYAELTFAAPYTEMIEEMTLREALQFHQRFRKFYPDVTEERQFIQALLFDFQPDQQIQLMSSGMKQRLRLAFAICTQSTLLLLDEPTSNLDEAGIHWFHGLLERFGKDRTVVIASNVREDLQSCQMEISLAKPQTS